MDNESKEKRIITAALKIFSKKGYHKATVSEIANEAEVAKGTVYWYFDSKKQLFKAILLSGINELNQRMKSKIIEVDDVKVKLEIIVNLLLEFFEKGKQLSKMYKDCTVSFDQEFKEQLKEFRREEMNLVANIIDTGKQEGQFKEEIDSKEAANLLLGMISTYNPHFCEQQVEVTSKVDVILDLFFNGVNS